MKVQVYGNTNIKVPSDIMAYKMLCGNVDISDESKCQFDVGRSTHKNTALVHRREYNYQLQSVQSVQIIKKGKYSCFYFLTKPTHNSHIHATYMRNFGQKYACL
jgi:hypothetical protein